MNALQDDKGNTSSMRIAFLCLVVGVFLVWAIVCVMSKAIVDLPSGIQTVLGMIMTGKVAQKFAEGK